MRLRLFKNLVIGDVTLDADADRPVPELAEHVHQLQVQLPTKGSSEIFKNGAAEAVSYQFAF